ncbi:hypothetical protein ACGF4C_30485 [Streptomyces sp. NPDC048197]|uniref:hypothetical protein n=1 Tax=Streptomyces sp. NPDC048197 TaxID=3365511 RepID=UPI00371CABB5
MSLNDKQPEAGRYTRVGETPPGTQAQQVARCVRGATPTERLVLEMVTVVAEHELDTTRERIGCVGEEARRGADVRTFGEEIYEAIAHELNHGDGELREIARTYDEDASR